MTTYRGLAWSEITVPTELAEVVDEISHQRVVMNPGATALTVIPREASSRAIERVKPITPALLAE